MRSHILVLPGGGYHRHAPHEAEPVAAWLRSLGVEASVLRYPVGERHPAVLDAVRGRIRAVRAAGAERVSLLGFSAGGHAAGHAALAPDAAPEERADLAILAYPVVSMLTETHAGSRENLLGPDATPESRAATSLERLVAPASPPVFLWHTADDAVVPVEHSYLLARALAEAGVPHELHVFPHGRHGLGLAAGSGAPAQWTRLCEAWLRSLGWIGRPPWWRRLLRR